MGGVRFEALEEPPRLRVADTVGNEQFTLFLDSPVEPEPVSAEGFTHPVSDAVRVNVAGFELQGTVRLHLWNSEGEVVEVVDHKGDVRVPDGDYTLEFCLPIKTYLQFSGAMSIESDADRAEVRFEGSTSVKIGSRSPRKRPAHTITTTEDPTDIMRSLSCLGDGLLTKTPMRALPNLRGYPPEIRLGETLDIPDGIDTGPRRVTLTLPPELEYLYEAAPLIYYLDADVQSGSKPNVLVDGESIYEFDPSSFADEIETVLKHVFLLDCVVRSVGAYPIESVECNRLADDIQYEFSTLYHADQGSRLRMYFDIPFDPVARQAPTWPFTVYVEPTVENVDSIPHVVAQLAPVRSTSPNRLSGSDARQAALTAFTDARTNTRAATEVFDGEASFVDLRSTGRATDVWVGSDVPISANKLVVGGFRNRFERPPSGQSSIDVTIVCNEAWMSEEASTVEVLYGEREDLPFEVTVHEHLDCGSLRQLLETRTDFLHFVGHATTEGLECSDGYLDVSTASSVEVETFFLNACQSYRQATKLVEGGAIGGIATLSDITDDQAAAVGRTATRLLNIGYPLQIALEIARSQSVVGGQYLVVGDGSVTLVPSDSVPHCGTLKSDGDEYELRLETHQTHRLGAGGLFSPWLGSDREQYLIGSSIGPLELSTEELKEFLGLENVPIDFDGEFRWAFDLAEELD